MTTHNDRIALAALGFLAQTSGQLDSFRARLRQRAQLHASSFVEGRYYGDDVHIGICLETGPQRVYDFQAVQAEAPEILEQLLRAGTAVLDKITTPQRLQADSQAREGNKVVE